MAAEQKPRGGLIPLFVRHPTAANLLMVAMIIAGLFAALRLNTQFFPSIEIPVITIRVEWPGASAEDVEKNIIEAIEPEVRFLDGLEDLTSIAREGVGVLTLEFSSSADMQKAHAEVEQAVDRITTFPEDAEDPVVTRIAFYESVANIAIYGPFPEKVLKSYAKQIRDGLLDAGIDRVTLNGARSEEIWVEVAERDLQRLDLTLGDIASVIRSNTRDLPSGTVEGEVDVQLRALAERKTPERLREIEVKALASGEKVLLGDIATVATHFDKDGAIGYRNGSRAIELKVERALSADTLKTLATLEDYLAKVRPQLPQALGIDVYDVRGKFVRQRLGILVKNGLQGLVLVLIILFIFLDRRIAFWTAVGIPVAFLATLAVMYLSGQSINMVSMFALIMMLGIIVDDAIVVGEHTATRLSRGDPPMLAAERGALQMLRPVLAATLTTQAAFLPIFLVRGTIGDVMEAIPLVVTAVLLASVIECFLILPGHLRHGRPYEVRAESGPDREAKGRFRRAFDRGLASFRDGPYRRLVALSYNWRYATAAFMIGALIVALGLVVGGRVGFTFFPSPEPENIFARVVFAAGVPREEQRKAMFRIEAALRRAETRLLEQERAQKRAQLAQKGQTEPKEQKEQTAQTTAQTEATRARKAAARADNEPGAGDWLERLGPLAAPIIRLLGVKGEDAPQSRLIETTFTILGKSGRTQGENVAEIAVQLTPSEERPISTKQILKVWRKELPPIPGVERVALVGRRAGPPGRDIDVRLQNAPVATLKRAAEELKAILATYPGVSALADDLPYGRPELVLELTPYGRALGFSIESVGQQVRNAFEGAIATRFARGDEEITVRVLRKQASEGLGALAGLYLKSPAGQWVPLNEVVVLRTKQGFGVIQRRDGVRTVGVTGDIDADVSSTEEVVARLAREVMPGLAAKYGITYAFKGRDEERRESFADLKAGGILALALIYIILAWVFASYTKPIAVMAIIPFGLVGAIVGHMVMGHDLTIVSLIGLLGLSGILVNDSIILMTRIKDRLERGDSLRRAAIGASQDRLRAVLLTSLTTIGGLLPLLFEQSRQAQFLIPMAITLVFGLAAATLLVLVLVPSLAGIGGDLGRLFGWLVRLAGKGQDHAPSQATRAAE